MEPQCQVRLEVFEGPLDLLLYLINKNKLDIADIPIALVTAQYLEYLEFMQALDLVVAGEYLVMAATLLQIKSKMLLPAPTLGACGAEDDPRSEIVRPLKGLVEIRRLAQALDARELLGRDVFIRDADTESQATESDLPALSKGNAGCVPRHEDVDLLDLVSAFRSVIKNRRLPRVVEIEEARCDLVQTMGCVLGLVSSTGRVSFCDLLTDGDRKTAVCIFISLLELARQKRVRLLQDVHGKDIVIVMRASS
ncbi:MAG: segregation and condensation protein A [Dissulfurimicrobium sp.]|uniref:segregation and condensation protein A n=1 Tax=Dissulfurimicrobium TaxID=1769732 RepID=UPI001ED9E0AD|nr:segregation/condensation protein A [Dissulfurimicrobium hydrothermale]UKL13782.1 segregation/condensation protein A [Dissulfurimicrobium hydrothermale]